MGRRHELARVLNVFDEPKGSVLSGAHSSSATTLTVDDTTDFDEQGGQVLINEVIYDYTAVDDDLNQITLATGLTASAADEDVVAVYPEATERIAACLPDGEQDEGEAVFARVRHALMDKMETGSREAGGAEWVRLRKDEFEWIVDDVLGKSTEFTAQALEQIVNNITVEGSPFYLDNAPVLHSTYGDHFTGASLDAKWTRRNLSSSDEAYQQGGGTWLQTTLSNSAASKIYTQTHSNDDTMEFMLAMSHITYDSPTSMTGLLFIDSNGDGAGICAYSNPWQVIVTRITAYVYHGSGSFLPVTQATNYYHGYNMEKIWLGLKRTKGSPNDTWTGRMSLDGCNWSPYRTTSTLAVPTKTIDRVGFGRWDGTPTEETLFVDLFNKI